jgi:hypothetical protein
MTANLPRATGRPQADIIPVQNLASRGKTGKKNLAAAREFAQRSLEKIQ